MCCSPRFEQYERKDINGTCPECDEETIDGIAFDSCTFSPTDCTVCEWAPCDQSC